MAYHPRTGRQHGNRQPTDRSISSKTRRGDSMPVYRQTQYRVGQRLVGEVCPHVPTISADATRDACGPHSRRRIRVTPELQWGPVRPNGLSILLGAAFIGKIPLARPHSRVNRLLLESYEPIVVHVAGKRDGLMDRGPSSVRRDRHAAGLGQYIAVCRQPAAQKEFERPLQSCGIEISAAQQRRLLGTSSSSFSL